jgi:TRAP-type mannitol/chloroaromatic compound transport system permease small subunit
MEGLTRILRGIDNINEWTGKKFSIISIVLMLVVVYDVIMRIIGYATLWGVEFSGFLLLALTYLAGGYALLHDAHVNVDLIYKALPLRVKALTDSLTYFVFFIVPIILVWNGGQVAWQSLRDHTLSPSAWGPPMWPSQMLIPIGGLLIGLQALARWIRSMHILLRGTEIQSSKAGNL